MENSIFNGNIMGISLSWGPQTAKLTHICLRELLGFNGKTLIRWGYDGGRMGTVIPITLHCTLKKIEKCMKLGVFTVLSMAVPINPTCCWRIFQISIQQCQASLVMMGILLGLMVFWWFLGWFKHRKNGEWNRDSEVSPPVTNWALGLICCAWTI